jgi:uncharacterized membrane protein
MRNPVFNRAIFVLSFVGLLIASYLWKMHAHPQDIPCGGTGGCEMVANSPYSRFPVGYGPPVAMYGALGYLAILILSLLRTLEADAATARSRDRILLILIVCGALFGTLASGYLTYMEIYVIDAICRWCMASQILILLILGLSVVEGILMFKGAKAIDTSGTAQ